VTSLINGTVLSAAQSARRRMLADDLAGWDPYDGLTSPLFRLPGLRRSWLVRFGAQQMILRAPFNLRPLLRIKPQVNAVTVALYLQGLVDLAAVGVVPRDRALAEIDERVDELARMRSVGSGACWGYPFPWEGRRHRMPAGTPTVVATSIVVNALFRVWRFCDHEPTAALIRDSARFVLEDLPTVVDDDSGLCWAYSPVDDNAVLNATLKGSRLLAQAVTAGYPDRDRALRAAHRSAWFVAAHAEASGRLPYAVLGDARTWADNFHTGYVLECFDEYRELTGDTTFDATIARASEYYTSSFFAEDGTPRYYDDRDGRLDPTAAGQAMLVLPRLGRLALAERVAAVTIERLQRSDGSFAYRPDRREHFVRWSTAWAFAGLTSVSRHRVDAENDVLGGSPPLRLD
jgi:hypothetical protein